MKGLIFTTVVILVVVGIIELILYYHNRFKK
jgi:hypothetical protein